MATRRAALFRLTTIALVVAGVASAPSTGCLLIDTKDYPVGTEGMDDASAASGGSAGASSGDASATSGLGGASGAAAASGSRAVGGTFGVGGSGGTLGVGGTGGAFGVAGSAGAFGIGGTGGTLGVGAAGGTFGVGGSAGSGGSGAASCVARKEVCNGDSRTCCQPMICQPDSMLGGFRCCAFADSPCASTDDCCQISPLVPTQCSGRCCYPSGSSCSVSQPQQCCSGSCNNGYCL